MLYLCEATVDVEVRIDEELELWLVCFNEEVEAEEEEAVLFVPKDARRTMCVDVNFEVEAESREEAKEKAERMLREENWDADFFDEGYELNAAVVVTNVKVRALKVEEVGDETFNCSEE